MQSMNRSLNENFLFKMLIILQTDNKLIDGQQNVYVQVILLQSLVQQRDCDIYITHQSEDRLLKYCLLHWSEHPSLSQPSANIRPEVSTNYQLLFLAKLTNLFIYILDTSTEFSQTLFNSSSYSSSCSSSMYNHTCCC